MLRCYCSLLFIINLTNWTKLAYKIVVQCIVQQFADAEPLSTSANTIMLTIRWQQFWMVDTRISALDFPESILRLDQYISAYPTEIMSERVSLKSPVQ